MPIITSGADMLACAQTGIISLAVFLFLGSGKTAAFLVPVLSKLFGKALNLDAPRPKPGMERGYQAQPLVLVLGPTRELVWQIFDEARKFCYRSMLRPWYLIPDIPILLPIHELPAVWIVLMEVLCMVGR